MFKAKIKYLGIDLEIESDDFSKMHEADVEGIYLGFRTDCQIEVVNSWEELSA